MFENIVAELIGFALGVVVAVLPAASYYLATHRVQHALWRLPRRLKTLHIVAASIPIKYKYSKKESWLGTGLGEMYAVSYLNQSLTECYPRSKFERMVVLSHDYHLSPTGSSDPLVVLGSSAYNPWAEKVHANLRPRFIVTAVGEGQPLFVLDRVPPQPRYVPELKNGRVVKDYAVISRFRNPRYPASFVLHLSAAQTWGVAGAGRMFTRDYAKSLRDCVKDLGPSWQVLLEVSVEGNTALPTPLLACKYPLP